MVEGSLEAKSGDLSTKMKKFWKVLFLGPWAEFPYLGIISHYQVFLHNEPISAWECNIHIIYESWVRKSSCNSRYARKLDFSYYAQIWKFGPRPLENYFFRKFLIFMKRSLNFTSNEPSTTPDIRFKSSYARKLDFSLLCPNMEIQPQATKNKIFQKFSFFWNGLQILLLTSSQPPADIKFKSSYARNILSKKLNLGLNFSTPSGGVTSPSFNPLGTMDFNVFIFCCPLVYSVITGCRWLLQKKIELYLF